MQRQAVNTLQDTCASYRLSSTQLAERLQHTDHLIPGPDQQMIAVTQQQHTQMMAMQLMRGDCIESQAYSLRKAQAAWSDWPPLSATACMSAALS